MAGASDILLEIAAKTRERIEEKQREKPLAQIRAEAEKIRAEELAAAGMEPDGTDTAAAGAGKPAAHRKSFIEVLKKPGMTVRFLHFSVRFAIFKSRFSCYTGFDSKKTLFFILTTGRSL